MIYLGWGCLSFCPPVLLSLLIHPELVALQGFVSVLGLTRPSELPHKHKHQRAVCLSEAAFEVLLGYKTQRRGYKNKAMMDLAESQREGGEK